MPSQAMLAKIHIAKKELCEGGCFTDQDYRNVLYLDFGVDSSKDLDDRQAGQLLDHFESLGWSPSTGQAPKNANKVKAKQKLSFAKVGDRDGFATQKQIWLIWFTWRDNPNVETKTEAALNKFLEHKFKISNLRFLEQEMVGKVLKAIEGIRKKGS